MVPIPEESRGRTNFAQARSGEIAQFFHAAGWRHRPIHGRPRVRLSHGSCFVVPVFALHRLSKVVAGSGTLRVSTRSASRKKAEGKKELLLFFSYRSMLIRSSIIVLVYFSFSQYAKIYFLYWIIDYRLSFSCIFLLTNVLKFIFYIEILNYRLLLSISIIYIYIIYFFKKHIHILIHYFSYRRTSFSFFPFTPKNPYVPLSFTKNNYSVHIKTKKVAMIRDKLFSLLN